MDVGLSGNLCIIALNPACTDFASGSPWKPAWTCTFSSACLAVYIFICGDQTDDEQTLQSPQLAASFLTKFTTVFAHCDRCSLILRS